MQRTVSARRPADATWLDRARHALEAHGATVHVAPNGHLAAVLDLAGALVSVGIAADDPVRFVVKADLPPTRMRDCVDWLTELVGLTPVTAMAVTDAERERLKTWSRNAWNPPGSVSGWDVSYP